MEAHPAKIAPAINQPVINQVPSVAPATAVGVKNPQPMKTRITMLRLLLVLSGTVAATAVFGQTTYTWTNAAGGDIATAANWDPNGQPSGATTDIAQWDGRTTGPLIVTGSATALPGTGYGTSGIGIAFTANQVSSVTFTSTASAFPGAAPYGVNDITIASGAGALTIGNPGGPGPGNTYLYNFYGRPAGAVHNFANNSSHPATINGGVRWQAGGGTAYTLNFTGSGDWIVNNYLVNDNNTGMIIQIDGPGTTTWTPGGYLGNSGLNTPITINGGALVLAANHPKLNTQAILNNAILRFNAPSLSQTLSGVISGTGELQVNNGSLTLQGASTYSGNTTLSGGTLIVNQAENAGTSGPLGIGGTISFSGGTLQFSVNNVFDYSPRFKTAASQAYSIDTGGQSVTFATGLGGSGSTLAKIGSGTLILAGTNSYSGATTVSAGRLLFQGAKSGSGDVTVADGAAVGVTATGTQVTPGTLTVGTSSGATLEFNNVNSTTTAPLAAGTLSSAGTLTVNIQSGAFTVGSSYPLLTWTSGSAPAVSLGVLNGFVGNLSLSGNSLVLNITGTAFLWTGANNNNWDLSTGNNWTVNGAPTVFTNGAFALFDDSATTTNVVIAGMVQPTSVTVNNGAKNYSISSTFGNAIGGGASLFKSGSGMLTLSGGANTNTGVTTIRGGVLGVGTLANGGAASDIGAASSTATNLLLNGGTLQYTGSGAAIDRLFTLGTAGGTIDHAGSGALNLNNSGALGYGGIGPRTLTLTGVDTNDNTLAGALGDNGGATALTKSGAGKWILTGTNTYSGVTTIAAGMLQIGAGGDSGSPGTGNIIDNGALVFKRAGTLTVTGAISGTGSVTNDGTGTVILAANNSYIGGTTINGGALQIGNGEPTGSLSGESPIVDNGTLIFNSTAPFTLAGFNAVISGTGNVWVRGPGLVKAIGNNTYSGWTTIDAGATFQPCEGNQGQLLSSVVTNNGTLKLVRQDFGPPVFTYSNNIVGTGRVVKDVNNFNQGEVLFTGANTYTGGTIIAGGGIVLGDGAIPGAGSLAGDVIFTNSPVQDTLRTLQFNRPDDFIFTNNIIGAVTGSPVGNSGVVIQNGAGTVTLTGNNTYTGGTTINSGTVQVGNGGTSGSIGTGPVTDAGVLIWNRSDDATFAGVISGAGSVAKMGAGTLTLTATNTYTGTTTVTNGTLIVNGDNSAGSTTVNRGGLGGTGAFAGTVILDPGTTFAPGASAGSVGTLTINSDLSLGGNLAIDVNKSLSPPNDRVVVSGNLNNTGTGTLTVANLGPALAVGDKFTLFSQPLMNGAALTVTGGGATWTNNLAGDGSISVASITIVTPPTLNYTAISNSLQFSWTGGFKLQAQTNSMNVGLSTNWVDYPGGGASPVTVPIDATKGSAFFRLVSKP